MKKIKFAVIGLGHIGLRHSKIAHEHPDSEIIACCDIYGAAGIDYLKTSTGYAEVGATA